MSTDGAGFGSVAGINELEWNTMQFRLVGRELFKLVKGPIGMSRSLRLPNPYPITNTGQIFHSDTAMGVLSLHDNGLAQVVIHGFLKARLLTTHLFQSAVGTFRSNRLKDIASFLIPLTPCFQLFAAKYNAIGIGGEIDNAKVNAKPVNWVILVGFNDFANLVKIKLFVSIDKVSFAKAMLQKLLLFGATDKGDALTTIHSPDIDGIVFHPPREDAAIVSDGTVLSKPPFAFPIELIGIGNLCNLPHGDLGREVELFTHRVIRKFVQIELAKRFSFPCLFADEIASIVGGFNRVKQCLSLFFGWFQFNLRYQFHLSSLEHIISRSQGFVKVR